MPEQPTDSNAEIAYLRRALTLITSGGGTPEERRAFCKAAGIDTADSASIAAAGLKVP